MKSQNINKTEIQIKDAVARAYYNALISEQNKEIFAENAEKLQEQQKVLSAIQKVNEDRILDAFMQDCSHVHVATKVIDRCSIWR